MLVFNKFSKQVSVIQLSMLIYFVLQVGRVTHAVITSCLPLSVYYFTRSMFKSRDAASLAAIMVSTSQTLNVLGTHPFINSFLSPIVFLCLTPLVKSLLSCKEQKTETTKNRKSKSYARP